MVLQASFFEGYTYSGNGFPFAEQQLLLLPERKPRQIAPLAKQTPQAGRPQQCQDEAGQPEE